MCTDRALQYAYNLNILKVCKFSLAVCLLVTKNDDDNKCVEGLATPGR